MDTLLILEPLLKCWDQTYSTESVTASPIALNKTIGASNNVTIPCWALKHLIQLKDTVKHLRKCVVFSDLAVGWESSCLYLQNGNNL